MQMRQKTAKHAVEGDHASTLLRAIDLPRSRDVTRQPRKVLSSPGLAKSRSMYFEDAFQAGREVSPAKDRIRSEALVMADVRTNVIVGCPEYSDSALDR